MRLNMWALGVLSIVLFACGDDEEAAGETCPPGASPGAMYPCTCGEDGGPMGMQTCQDDNTLGACDCDGPAAGTGGAGTGGSSGTGSSGTGSSGTGASGTGASGSAGRDVPNGDGGVLDGGRKDASTEPNQPSDLPDDGDQSAVCDDDEACNDGLACFDQGSEGQGFCSTECEGDEDCEDIGDEAWRCSNSTGVCVVDCDGEDDDESCPDAMVCVETQSGAGMGFPGTFRCKYPEPAGTQGPFAECDGDEDCKDGLYCQASTQGGFGGTGYCTMECEDTECSIDAPSGSLEVSCGGSTGGGVDRCVIDCEEREDGCPDGMSCLMYGRYMRCGYE